MVASWHNGTVSSAETDPPFFFFLQFTLYKNFHITLMDYIYDTGAAEDLEKSDELAAIADFKDECYLRNLGRTVPASR